MNKLFGCLIFLALFPFYVNAQNWYEMNFNAQIKGQSVQVKSLLVQQAEDLGFIRMRYDDPVTHSDCLLEMKYYESDAFDNNGRIMNNAVLMQTTDVELLMGETEKWKPVFLFRLNAKKELEPAGIVDELGGGKWQMTANSNFKNRSVPNTQIDTALLYDYFFQDDPFVLQALALNSKDISPAERKINIHLILVANTLDKSIGVSCQKDMARTEELFKNIAKFLGTPIKIKRISGTQFSKKNVLSALVMLQPQRDKDIVVFYYSGHGFRQPNDSRRFPHMDLTYKPGQDYNKEKLSIVEVYDRITAKGARLNLVLGDCCNSYVGAPLVSAPWFLKKKTIPAFMFMNNVRKLFLDPQPKSILACAADTTQRAAGNKKMGGFFSYFFKSSLEAHCSKSKTGPSWYNIFEDTKVQTSRKANRTYCDTPRIETNICYQTPVYDVND